MNITSRINIALFVIYKQVPIKETESMTSSPLKKPSSSFIENARNPYKQTDLLLVLCILHCPSYLSLKLLCTGDSSTRTQNNKKLYLCSQRHSTNNSIDGIYSKHDGPRYLNSCLTHTSSSV